MSSYFKMKFPHRDIISINDFSKEDILSVLDVAKKMEKKASPTLLKGKILATLFFEPSTRTRLSFVSAMEKLGGQVIGFGSPDSSSIKKGESLWDTVKMTDKYADIIALRHPLEGSARLASEASSKPVINAGDGANQHPTQTLLDLYTIQKAKGTLNNLKVGILGDLKYGRTVHSLAIALSHFNPEFTFIAPDALQMPRSYLDMLNKKKIRYRVTQQMMEPLGGLDILYVTRIQQERFPDPLEYERYKGMYKVDKKILGHIKKDMKIMHPLPRVDEIDPALDSTEHALYFEQAANGVPMRQALLAILLGRA